MGLGFSAICIMRFTEIGAGLLRLDQAAGVAVGTVYRILEEAAGPR